MEREQTETSAYLSSDKSQNTHCLFLPAGWKETHWINWFKFFFQETRNHKVKKKQNKKKTKKQKNKTKQKTEKKRNVFDTFMFLKTKVTFSTNFFGGG